MYQRGKTITSPQEVFLLLEQRQLWDSQHWNHEAELVIPCEISHQSPKPFLGERGNQVTAISPERIFFHSSDEMTSNLDLPLALSELLERRVE